eukprot:3101674-Rhodomonas_salina.1
MPMTTDRSIAMPVKPTAKSRNSFTPGHAETAALVFSVPRTPRQVRMSSEDASWEHHPSADAESPPSDADG